MTSITLAAIVVACASETPGDPDASGLAALTAVVIVPAGAPEGPVLRPASVRLTATPPGGRAPTSAVFAVSGGSARGEVTLARIGPVERWRLRAAAAVAGDTIFRAVDDVELTLDAPRPDVRLVLIYAARDLAIASLEVRPRDTTLTVGTGVRLRVAATDVHQAALAPPLGWRSRREPVARVDATGHVTAVAPGEAWIVGRSFTGLADSVRVVVR